MPVSVNVQNMFSYSVFLFGALALIGLLAVIALIVALIFVSGKSKANPKPVNLAGSPVTGKGQVKQRYLSALDDIERACQSRGMTGREAYQRLSVTVRSFVYEMTGKNVVNATLEELKESGVPALYEIIEECYAPEFSRDGAGDIFDSIQRARKVIEKWS